MGIAGNPPETRQACRLLLPPDLPSLPGYGKVLPGSLRVDQPGLHWWLSRAFLARTPMDPRFTDRSRVVEGCISLQRYDDGHRFEKPHCTGHSFHCGRIAVSDHNCHRPRGLSKCSMGASTLRNGNARTRVAQGIDARIIIESQRRPLVLTTNFFLERIGAPLIPFAAIVAPRRRCMVSSVPTRRGVHPTQRFAPAASRRCG